MTKEKRFIIVKYAEDHFPDGYPVHISNSVFGTYSANKCGVEKEVYISKEEAEHDLTILQDYNPAVGYGIVELWQENMGIKRSSDET